MLKLLLPVLFLTGCANTAEYYKSVEASNAALVSSVKAQAEADAARFHVLMKIAESGDATAKVAATMALALGGSRPVPAPAVAAQPQNEALQWASVLVPGLMGYYNMKTNMNASDNATNLGMNTNATFGTLGAQISKPPLVVNQPAPVVVEQPAPIVVNQPEPIIVEPSYPPVVPVAP